MTNKFNVVSPTGTYQTVKQLAAGSAKTKGDAFLLGGILAVPFDSYDSGNDQLHVYKAAQVLAEAQAADSQIAQRNYALLGKLYWDDTNKKITNVATDNTLIGRALEAKDLSSAVPAGSTLLFELDPSAA